MTKPRSKKFHGQSFTSLFSIFSFLLMTISGVILYFAPPGRISHWSHWKFWALTKEQWQALHTIFSLAFIIIVVFHLYYNWSVLIGYLKTKIKSGINRRKELAWSTVLTIALTILTIANVPPFSTIMDWSEDLSNSWSNEKTEPPIPHAEAMTLTELSSTLQIPVTDFMGNLKRAGMEPDSAGMLVEDLAKKYNVTPRQVFEKMNTKTEKTQSGNSFRGGYGRKSVQEICEQYNVTVDAGLARLKQNGIDAKPDDTIRDIANGANMLPVDIVSIIQSAN
ncbi:MAG: DUF4405 domain-containing protein [Candidatus Zhuqueibacterota bacterium]